MGTREGEDLSTSDSDDEGSGTSSSNNPFAALAQGSTEEVEAQLRDVALGDEESGGDLRGPKRPPVKVRNPLVWIDLEMTGLDPDVHTIIEIAAIVTDGNLAIKHVGPNLVVQASEEAIEGMNEWSKEQHAKSGLTERVRASETSMAAAEEQVLAFVSKHCDQGWGVLAGNAVYTDQRFLRRYMPRLCEYLSWRLLDVSTVSWMARAWFPRDFNKKPRKVAQHTAMSDIEESLEELKYYRRKIFKKRSEQNR